MLTKSLKQYPNYDWCEVKQTKLMLLGGIRYLLSVIETAHKVGVGRTCFAANSLPSHTRIGEVDASAESMEAKI